LRVVHYGREKWPYAEKKRDCVWGRLTKPFGGGGVFFSLAHRTINFKGEKRGKRGEKV